MDDHNPPAFEQLVQFINRAEQFMNGSPQNVIALHCKGGKGRTVRRRVAPKPETVNPWTGTSDGRRRWD